MLGLVIRAMVEKLNIQGLPGQLNKTSLNSTRRGVQGRAYPEPPKQRDDVKHT